MAASSNTKPLMLIILVILVGIAVYGFLNLPDNRTSTEKVGDAIHDIDKGPDKAFRQLENRTPGDKLGDAVKDAGDDIKKNSGGN